MDANAREDGENASAEEAAVVSEAVCDRIWFIGRLHAQKYGYRGEAAVECAQAFVVHMLQQNRRSRWLAHRKSDLTRWLFACADNFVKNIYRQGSYRRAHECPWQPSFSLLPAPEPSPYHQMLRRELYDRLVAPAARLNRRQQILFVGNFLNGESIKSLARSLHLPSNTLRQRKWALCHRLRDLLEEAGMSPAEIKDYLYQLALPE